MDRGYSGHQLKRGACRPGLSGVGTAWVCYMASKSKRTATRGARLLACPTLHFLEAPQKSRLRTFALCAWATQGFDGLPRAARASAHPRSLTPAARPWRIAAARPRLRLRDRLWPSRASARASGASVARRHSNELGCRCCDAWLAAACARAQWRGCGSRAATAFGLSCSSTPVAPRTR